MSTAFVCNRIERKALIGSVLRTDGFCCCCEAAQRTGTERVLVFFAFVFTFLIFPRKTSFRQRYKHMHWVLLWDLSKLLNVGGNHKTLLILTFSRLRNVRSKATKMTFSSSFFFFSLFACCRLDPPGHSGPNNDPELCIGPLESPASVVLHSAHHKPAMEGYGKFIRELSIKY